MMVQHLKKTSFLIPTLALCCLASEGGAADAKAKSMPMPADVRAVLEKHCFACHGPEKQKGKIRLDDLSDDFLTDRQAAETWHDASDLIQIGEMPPEDEAPMSEAERSLILNWIDGNLKAALAAASGETSGVVMRRLNRAEYQYTMSDLLGLEMDYSSELPADALSSDGFRNNGASLGMSALQIENYLKSAREALGFVLVEGEQPERVVEEVKEEKRNRRGRNLVGEFSERLGRVNFWRGSFKGYPKSGDFTIRITARVEGSKDSAAPVLALDYGYFVSGLTVNIGGEAGEILIDSHESKTYELHGKSEFFPMPDGEIPPSKLNGVITVKNILDDGNPAPKQLTKEVEEKKGNKTVKKKVKYYPEDPDFPIVVIESVEFVRNDYPAWPTAEHRQIIPEGEDLATLESVERVLKGFLRRAWRRPATPTEVSAWRDHYQTIRDNSETEIEALRETFAAVLASPAFLYLSEPRPEGEASRPLDDYEIAARLSYFVWNSMPDAELSALADAGELSNPDVLRKQLARMLDDEKSERFVKHFSTQWLDLEGVDRVAVNPSVYGKFDNALKPDMIGETQAFFREILRTEESALRFLDADFTMLNGPLAKHYGIESKDVPRSQRFERVSLQGTGRPGGLLGHASVHLAGSDGADSHPIKRAVWILERLLHDPPKPPPPNVPDLNASTIQGFDKLSIAEQLKVHREKAACNDCHRGIDPWGIALEGYDAIGLAREKTARGKKPVITETVLPGNHQVDGLDGLKAYLVNERRDQFAHALVAKMLTYALGRSLEFADEAAIEDLTHQFEKGDYLLSNLMESIVTSKTFLTR